MGVNLVREGVLRDMASIAVPGTDRGVDAEGCGTYELDVSLRLSHDRLLLVPTLESAPSTVLRLDSPVLSDSDADHLTVTASGGRLAGGLPDVLCADPTVEDAVLVSSFRTEALYRVGPAADARRLLVPFADAAAVLRDVRGRGDHWDVRAYLPSRSALACVVDRLRERGIRFEVRRLVDLRAVERPEVSTLTDAQRELLTVAVERGYFETPRGVSQRELAAAFDVSTSAISQRLRGATGTVVEQILLGH